MKIISGRNINEVYVAGLNYLREHGEDESSRVGRVVVSPCPVVSVYARPRERVLFSPERDANPFFHIMEGLWMLNGQRDAAWPCLFNKSMKKYANEDGTYDGAYGHRWRHHFGVDQIQCVVEELLERPKSRRAVIAMFDPAVDNNPHSSDIPCNTTIYFRLRFNKLEMTVCCRSNDAIWGAYGANVVHMSMLQEVIASQLRAQVGTYYQISNNFHLYTDMGNHAELLRHPVSNDYYRTEGYPAYPLVSHPDSFFEELAAWMDTGLRAPKNNFFYYVADPMFYAWEQHKDGNDGGALQYIDEIEDMALQHVCREWILRRAK